MTVDAELSGVERLELANLAERAVRALTITELHGAACGVLAGGGAADDLLQLLGADALVDSTTLMEFWRSNAIFAFDEDMRFTPIMAAEEGAPLAARVDDLAQWSASFLAGFARLSGGNAGLAKLPEESREIVQDLAAVAGAEADIGPDASATTERDATDDDNEADYVQLVEFVRVAVLLLLSAQLPTGRQTEGEPH